jgi:hypothetical protein
VRYRQGPLPEIFPVAGPFILHVNTNTLRANTNTNILACPQPIIYIDDAL